MSLTHPITKVIFDSLVRSPKGFELDRKRLPLITHHLTNDPAATAAFHETLGLLELSNGKLAADALRQLIIDKGGKPAKAWGAR
jgi:hypothetical protein